MNRYLIEYKHGYYTCDADDRTHAVEQFQDAYGEEAIHSVAIVLDHPGIDEFHLNAGVADIKLISKPQQGQWIGIGKLSIYIKHEDEGVVVDIWGDLDGESLGSTYAHFSEAEEEA